VVTDLAEVCGQEAAKRALEVAAAGGHILLLIGSAGAGKSLLARCLPGLLPADVPRPVRVPGPGLTPKRVAEEITLAGGGTLLFGDLPAPRPMAASVRTSWTALRTVTRGVVELTVAVPSKNSNSVVMASPFVWGFGRPGC
jgi:energy-coupling factor transporter ATP-binding protein EcfA2